MLRFGGQLVSEGGAMQTAGFEGPTVSPQELCKQPTP